MAPMRDANDDNGAEDVNDFLQRIKELGDQRDQEDEARNKKLEEDIIQGRKERQARRAERARSLSPTKPQQADGTIGINRDRSESPAIQLSSRSPTLSRPSTPHDNIYKLRGAPAIIPASPPQVTSKLSMMSSASPSSAMPFSRGTASWQHRAESQTIASPRAKTDIGSVVSSAPVQTLADKSAKTASAPLSDAMPSKGQITQTLEGKDPSWFQQTQDRGQNSAAYRRTRESEVDETLAKARTHSIGLPGMTNSGSGAREGMSAARFRGGDIPKSLSETVVSDSNRPARAGSNQSSTRETTQPSFALAESITSQDAGQAAQGLAMSPSQGRISADRRSRSQSPTKGLGGFVQSAMMKRSDSVTKRWSAQTTPGLSRADSVTTGRGSTEPSKFIAEAGLPTLGAPTRATLSREATPTATPAVRSTILQDTPSSPVRRLEREDMSPTLDCKYRSNPSAIDTSTTKVPSSDSKAIHRPSDSAESADAPTSPSKRWSPQKSSWLENAINRPESPKPLSPSLISQQPAWMADVNRAKQQRGSVDLSKSSSHKPIVTGGLMRSPPLAAGYRPPGMNGLVAGISTGHINKPRSGSIDAPTGRDIENRALNIKHSGLSNLTHSVSAPLNTTTSSTKETTPEPDTRLRDTKPARGSQHESSTPSPPAIKKKPDLSQAKTKSPLLDQARNPDRASSEQPEFKNVFGNLRKTQTNNYKAPDELKDNIMRGKAGLNATGGPRRTVLKDEFKESILKKKHAMTVPPMTITNNKTTAGNTNTVIPEAIRKRGSLVNSNSGAVVKDHSSPAESLKTSLKVPEKSAAVPRTTDLPRTSGDTEPRSSTSGKSTNFSSSLAGLLQRGPPGVRPAPAYSSPQFHDATDVPNESSDSSSAPQLSHMTKSRARGPKRKPPTAIHVEPVEFGIVGIPETAVRTPSAQSVKPSREQPEKSRIAKSPVKQVSRPLSNITTTNNNNRKTSQTKPVQQSPTGEKLELPIRSMPTPTRADGPSNTPGKASSIVTHDRISSKTLEESRAAKVALVGKDSVVQEPVESNNPGPDLEQTRAQPIIPQVKKSTLSTKDSRSNINTKTPASSISRSPLQSPSSIRSSSSPKSPPLPGKKPAINVNRNSPSAPTSTVVHSTQLSNTPPPRQVCAEIFDVLPSSATKFNIPSQKALDARSSKTSFPKIKTARKEITEVMHNGKLIPVSGDQEHILFEDSMYLCTHAFNTQSGQRFTEVYLWVGDGVSSAAVEDAQIFAKKAAKDNSGKLIVLKQGKETSNFFQALGGIVITRRGSGQPNARSATYMLCGRQHVGQVAFDEIDFNSDTLCSAFAYIVSAAFGKLYLWKGKGASADELGCARLIGMDLGLTGEIEELDEGKESADFWAAFPSKGSPATMESLAYWQRKPSCENYAVRAFAVSIDTARPKSASSFMAWGRRGSTPMPEVSPDTNVVISEIVPFSSADLIDDCILVLDTFFEIFVIHATPSFHPAPHKRSAKASTLQASLLFAQEYAILAASTDDRPFVPQSSLVLLSRDQGDRVGPHLPQGLKTAFRKWDMRSSEEACVVYNVVEALQAFGN